MRTILCLTGAATLLTGIVCAAPLALAAGPSTTRYTIVTSDDTSSLRPALTPLTAAGQGVRPAMVTVRPTLAPPVAGKPVKPKPGKPGAPAAKPVAKPIQCTTTVLARKNAYVASIPAGAENAPCFLNPGASNIAVTALQNTLAKCYEPTLLVDGRFGPGTKNALMKAQKAIGLNADGAYGPTTRTRLEFLWLDTATPGRAACGKL